jgi:hypothetical protein
LSASINRAASIRHDSIASRCRWEPRWGARVAWKREGGEHTFSSPDKRAFTTKTDRGRQETSAHVGTNTAPFKGQPGGSVRGQQLLQAPQGVGGRGGCAARGLPTKRPPEEGREQCVCGWRGHRPRFQTQRLCQSHTASLRCCGARAAACGASSQQHVCHTGGGACGSPRLWFGLRVAVSAWEVKRVCGC